MRSKIGKACIFKYVNCKEFFAVTMVMLANSAATKPNS
jgi:hypothetical protein